MMQDFIAQKILVMTDIHLLTAGKTIIGLDPYARFCAALAHARENHPDAVRLVLTGDLTDTGKPEEYQRLHTALKDFDIPISFLIGNHDRRAEFRRAFPDAPVDENGFIQSVVDLGDTVLVCLDTVNDIAPDRDHSGVFCQKRRDWLVRVLSATREKRVLIFMHHPPFQVGFSGMDAIALVDGADFIQLLQGFDIAHLIAGHVHRTISGSTAGLSFSMFKSTCHQMPMDMTATNMMLSVDEPPAYGIILLGKDSVIAHSDDFDIADKGR